MSVLVDSSVWIDYFRRKNNKNSLELLIDDNLVIINDLILAELIPSLKIRKHHEVISLLYNVERVPIRIDWKHIIDMQVICINKGINKVGIPDLIIAQNAMQNSLDLYSLDKHFKLMRKYITFSQFPL